jgi:hypothetical protein
MTIAGLRLTILQELVGAKGADAVRNFEQQRDSAIAFHKSMDALIDAETDPLLVINNERALRNVMRLSGPFQVWAGQGTLYYHNNQPALGGAVTGHSLFIDGKWVPLDRASDITRGLGLALVDWPARRRDLKAHSTNLGAAAVARWERAKPAGGGSAAPTSSSPSRQRDSA